MITVTVLYPKVPGVGFDTHYYLHMHMPLVRERLSPALESAGVEFGISGAGPDDPAPFAALCHLRFASVEDFNEAFAPHAGELVGDVGNFTAVQPVFQISEIAG